MDLLHLKIRLPSWKTIWISTAIIVVTVAIIQSANVWNNFYTGLLFFSGGFIWLPVILSYVFSYVTVNKEYDIRTFQRCFVFLVITTINIYLANLLLDSFSSGKTSLVYMMAYPIQVVMVLVFDILLFLARKYGK